MKVTIRTIAEACQVSRGTVDRVIHGRPNVKPEIRERVLAKIRELNYVPNLTARALAKSNIRRTIGVVIPVWLEGSFDSMIVQGLQNAATTYGEQGIRLDIRKVKADDIRDSVQVLKDLQQEKVDAVICCCRNVSPVNQVVDELADAGIPVVTINCDLPDSRRVSFYGEEQRRCGRIAADIMRRCLVPDSQILVIQGNLLFSGHRARPEGFLESLEEKGMVLDQIRTCECNNDYAETYDCVSEFLNEFKGRHGIYMASESVAACAAAVADRGRADETTIVFHDWSAENQSFMEEGVLDFCLDQNLYEQAYQAVTSLAEHLIFDQELVPGIHYTQTRLLTASSLRYCTIIS